MPVLSVHAGKNCIRLQQQNGIMIKTVHLLKSLFGPLQRDRRPGGQQIGKRLRLRKKFFDRIRFEGQTKLHRLFAVDNGSGIYNFFGCLETDHSHQIVGYRPADKCSQACFSERNRRVVRHKKVPQAARTVESRLILCYVIAVGALLIYLAQADLVMDKIRPLFEQARSADRYQGILGVLWPTVWVCAVVPLLFIEISYAPMNLAKTLEVYDQTADFLNTATLHEDELARSIIGTIGDIDQYMLPDAKGYVSMFRHITGQTDKERQQIREEVLNASVSDFRSFGQALETFKERGLVKVLGSEKAIQEAQTGRQEGLHILKVI